MFSPCLSNDSLRAVKHFSLTLYLSVPRLFAPHLHPQTSCEQTSTTRERHTQSEKINHGWAETSVFHQEYASAECFLLPWKHWKMFWEWWVWNESSTSLKPSSHLAAGNFDADDLLRGVCSKAVLLGPACSVTTSPHTLSDVSVTSKHLCPRC